MTTVTQVPPPLQLRPRPKEFGPDPKQFPPTYPMQPLDMQIDLYEPEPNPDIAKLTESGLRRRAPYQYGHWVLQPDYNRCLHSIIDTAEYGIFSRQLTPVSEQWGGKTVIEALQKIKFPEEVRWLHCLRVPPSDTGVLDFTMIVLDFIHPTLIHAGRRDILQNLFPELGIKTRLPKGQIVLVPEFPEESSVAEDLWAALHILNKEWGNDLYRGIVCKQANARYHMQSESHDLVTAKWQQHKFSFPRAE